MYLWHLKYCSSGTNLQNMIKAKAKTRVKNLCIYRKNFILFKTSEVSINTIRITESLEIDLVLQVSKYQESFRKVCQVLVLKLLACSCFICVQAFICEWENCSTLTFTSVCSNTSNSPRIALKPVFFPQRLYYSPLSVAEGWSNRLRISQIAIRERK